MALNSRVFECWEDNSGGQSCSTRKGNRTPDQALLDESVISWREGMGGDIGTERDRKDLEVQGRREFLNERSRNTGRSLVRVEV